MPDVLLNVVTRLLFSLSREKVGDINQQSAQQLPRWLLFTFVAAFIAAAAFGIAMLVSQIVRLLSA